jgi:hypothetical protein
LATFLLLQIFCRYILVSWFILKIELFDQSTYLPIFTRWWLFGAYKLLGEKNFEFWSIWFLSSDVFLIAIQLLVSNQQSTSCMYIHLLKSGTFAIKQSCTFGSAWPLTTALRGIKYWKKIKIGPFYWTLVSGGWPVKTMYEFTVARIAHRIRGATMSSWWKRKETQFDLILGHGHRPFEHVPFNEKQKGFSFSFTVYISEFNAFRMYICIITRAARSAHLSSTLSPRPSVLSLVFFNPPSHSHTIPHTLSPSAQIARAFVFLYFWKFSFLFFS